MKPIVILTGKVIVSRGYGTSRIGIKADNGWWRVIDANLMRPYIGRRVRICEKF